MFKRNFGTVNVYYLFEFGVEIHIEIAYINRTKAGVNETSLQNTNNTNRILLRNWLSGSNLWLRNKIINQTAKLQGKHCCYRYIDVPFDVAHSLRTPSLPSFASSQDEFAQITWTWFFFLFLSFIDLRRLFAFIRFFCRFFVAFLFCVFSFNLFGFASTFTKFFIVVVWFGDFVFS